MIATFHILALLGYLASWIFLLRGFRDPGSQPASSSVRLALAGAALHVTGLVAFVLVHHAPPLVGLGPASSTLALAIAAAFLIASAVRGESRASGLFLLPCVLLLLGEAVAVGVEPASRETAFRGPWFIFHVSVIFVGYAGLLLASVAGFMYVLQFRALKRKRFGSVFRFFPSLDGLDRLNRVGLAVGFPALTLGLLAGWSFTLTYGRGLALADAEVVFGVVTWFAYLAAIGVRARPGSHGHPAAVVTAAAFALTFTAFVALRLTLSPSGFFL